jgi:hypothetical protein
MIRIANIIATRSIWNFFTYVPLFLFLFCSYAWASDSGLDVLVKLMDEATNSLNWKAVRQWGDEQDPSAESLRDAVILYDRSMYIGTGIEKPEVGAFRDNDDLLAGMQDDIKAQLAGFIGRWAGIELEVLGPDGKAGDLMFLLVSYHGRKMMRANNDILPVQTAVKAAMAKDFISQVADLGAKESAPALIAGCWNIDSMPLTAHGGHRSCALSKAEWTCTVHHSDAVEKDSVGQPMNKVDYGVAIHPAPLANTTTDLKVLDVVTLEHPQAIASHFQHKPLLLKIQVAPKA